MVAIKVLHIIDALSRGGAGRALVTIVKNFGQNDEFTHQAISLQPADPFIAEMALQAGLNLIDAPDQAARNRAMAQADIVTIHFWNTPEIFHLLTSKLPPARLIIWSLIYGLYPPHRITRELYEFAD